MYSYCYNNDCFNDIGMVAYDEKVRAENKFKLTNSRAYTDKNIY